MSIPRPETISIGPYTYRLTSDHDEWARLSETLTDDHWGYTAHAAGVIYIQPSLNPSLERTIVLHELVHAAAFAAGTLFDGKRHEEEWVLRTAPMLLDALRRNPALTVWLGATEAGPSYVLRSWGMDTEVRTEPAEGEQ